MLCQEKNFFTPKFKAIEIPRSISDLVNAAVKEGPAEDAEDLPGIAERADEPLISYDEMVKRLRKDGRIEVGSLKTVNTWLTFLSGPKTFRGR